MTVELFDFTVHEATPDDVTQVPVVDELHGDGEGETHGLMCSIRISATVNHCRAASKSWSSRNPTLVVTVVTVGHAVSSNDIPKSM